jgi:hypothetical protein
VAELRAAEAQLAELNDEAAQAARHAQAGLKAKNEAAKSCRLRATLEALSERVMVLECVFAENILHPPFSLPRSLRNHQRLFFVQAQELGRPGSHFQAGALQYRGSGHV